MTRIAMLQSGGLDSNIITAILKHAGFKEIHCLFIDYGQNQVEQERKMAMKICEHYGATFHNAILRLPWLTDATKLVGHAINDWGEEGELNAIATGVYVPMRNMMLMSLLSSLAESLDHINFLANGFDGSQRRFSKKPTGGTTDKHPKFVKLMEKTFTEGSALFHVHGEKFKIYTPLMDCTKADIIRYGVQANADMSLSWSCYNNEEQPCMKCSACSTRAKGFLEAGIPDPVLEKFGIEQPTLGEL